MQSVAAELQHETVAAERFRRASPHIVAAGRCRRALMQSVAAVLFIENVGDVSRVSQQLFGKSVGEAMHVRAQLFVKSVGLHHTPRLQPDAEPLRACARPHAWPQGGPGCRHCPSFSLGGTARPRVATAEHCPKAAQAAEHCHSFP